MKKGINGKSFDEIFAERGFEVKVDDLKSKSIYLFDCNPFLWIAEFSHIDEGDRLLMFNDSICNDGDFDSDDGERGVPQESIFEPTPNQIALLNLYKTESK